MLKYKKAWKANLKSRKYTNRWLLRTAVIWIVVVVIFYVFCWFYGNEPEPTFISPVPETKAIVRPVVAAEPYLEGMATWYGTGVDECLGCGINRIMANGKRLDDTALTVACGVGGSCKQFPLVSKVKIINLENMMTVEAEVTDIGGFSKFKDNRIIDVTKAVRDSLNMGGMAKVRVHYEKNN